MKTPKIANIEKIRAADPLLAEALECIARQVHSIAEPKGLYRKEDRMTNWSKQVVGRLKELAEQKRIEDEKSLQDTKRREAGLQCEWNTLCQTLKRMCDELNEEPELGFRVTFAEKGANKVEVGRLDSGVVVSGEISPALYRFNFHGRGAYTFEFGVELSSNGQEWFLTEKGKPISAGNMAQRVMGELLGI